MTKVQEHVARSEAETLEIAGRMARELEVGSVVAIDGELGAGKTAFVRGLVQALGGNGQDVSSPTFVIVQEYTTPKAPFVHIDAYRLSDPAELETIGWDEMLAARDAIIAIEWAERMAAALPEDAIHVAMAHVADEPTHRAITITRQARPATMLACPICKALAPSDAEFAPFCSQRCKRADLGRWLSGKYTISRPLAERDIESQD